MASVVWLVSGSFAVHFSNLIFVFNSYCVDMVEYLGWVASLVKSTMNGLTPFERTREQSTEAPGPKIITAADKQ